MEKQLTLAQLKRDITSEKLEGLMILRCGDSLIPEKYNKWRKIVPVNTRDFGFVNDDGKISHLSYPKASLLEYYDNNILRIFDAGYRELNAKEQSVVDKWRAIKQTDEYKKLADLDLQMDTNISYFKKLNFFKENEVEYLISSLHKKRGMVGVFVDGKLIVRDEKVKGELSMVYLIRKTR